MVRALFLGLAAGGMLLAAAAYADTPKPVWELECKPVAELARMGCLVRTELHSAKTGQTIMRVDLLPKAAMGNANAMLRLFLPHGVALNAPVEVQIDKGQVYRLPLMSSERDGVLAYQFIGADIVQEMRKGVRLRVGVMTVQGDKATNEVSLRGLTLALDSVAKMMGEVPAGEAEPAAGAEPAPEPDPTAEASDSE